MRLTKIDLMPFVAIWFGYHWFGWHGFWMVMLLTAEINIKFRD